MVEYVCGGCGYRFESLEESTAGIPNLLRCACGSYAELAVSAPRPATIHAATSVIGKDEPPPKLGDANNAAIEDGETVGSWKRGRVKSLNYTAEGKS
jgi:hypothetical protein